MSASLPPPRDQGRLDAPWADGMLKTHKTLTEPAAETE